LRARALGVHAHYATVDDILIYSTLFAVEQYSSKKIDEKDRERQNRITKKNKYISKK